MGGNSYRDVLTDVLAYFTLLYIFNDKYYIHCQRFARYNDALVDKIT